MRVDLWASLQVCLSNAQTPVFRGDFMTTWSKEKADHSNKFPMCPSARCHDSTRVSVRRKSQSTHNQTIQI
eukprot:5845999-Amphidinium_carterae.1